MTNQIKWLMNRGKKLCDQRFEIEVKLMMIYQQMGDTEKVTQCKKFIERAIARDEELQ